MHKTDTPEKVASTDELGQLPEPVDLLQAVWRGDREFMRPVGDYYNADQMRAYAAEQVAADRERICLALPGGWSVDPQWVADMVRDGPKLPSPR